MYTDFYNLREQPFDLTPSPRFLYLGEVHKEALAILTYGVVERKGFVLLTGEVGTGKSTMVQALLAGLDKDVQYVYVSNPLFSPTDFINYLSYSTFREKAGFTSRGEFLIEFESFLRECLQRQKNFILIIDEAQDLSLELLEEIRLLSNMETADKKMISIFLVGQPELNEKLSHPRCRPLLQRIGIRYHVKPLDVEGTREYIATRLKMAGSEHWDKILPKNVIKAIYQYSQGYPRMINILADNVLLLGYSRGQRRITPSMVKLCYDDLRLEGSSARERGQESETQRIMKSESPEIGGRWKWAAALFLMLAISAVAMSWHGRLWELAFPREADYRSAPEGTSKRRIRENEEVNQRIQDMAKNDTVVAARAPAHGAVDNDKDGMNIIPPKEPRDLEGHIYKNDRAQWKTVIVKQGDSLTELVTTAYGRVNEDILNLVRRYNPEIEDINLIGVGKKIVLPPLSQSQHESAYTVHIASFKPFPYALNLFERLMKEGYEVCIFPTNEPKKGKIYRVTLGNFGDPQQAHDYRSKILKTGVSDYARVMQVDMK